MVAWLLAVRVVGGPLSSVVWGLAAVCVLALLARRPTAGWTVRLGLGVVVGALVGVGAVVLVDATDAFGAPVPLSAAVWASAASAAVGLAIAGLGRSSTARSTRWRRAVAVALLVLAPLSAGLGINTFFGIDRTVGALVGVTILPAAESLPARRSDPPPPGPVWESWAPPSGMPAHGEVRQLSGEFAIPSSSGFTPRDAAIYLPPAALVDHPPPLPFAVFMMGMPGNPDPELIRAALDEIAAENSGLAPIVIVADQLGGRYQDPACADSTTFGGVSTYVNEDIPAYARSKLNILPDARHWTIMGFSNGGACAFAWRQSIRSSGATSWICPATSFRAPKTPAPRSARSSAATGPHSRRPSRPRGWRGTAACSPGMSPCSPPGRRMPSSPPSRSRTPGSPRMPAST